MARRPSAVVELNPAVAVAMADGPAAGLKLVEALEASGALAGYHLLLATRADPLRRLKRHAERGRQLSRGARAGGHRRQAPVTSPDALARLGRGAQAAALALADR